MRYVIIICVLLPLGCRPKIERESSARSPKKDTYELQVKEEDFQTFLAVLNKVVHFNQPEWISH
jgi:hypothetical protein